MAPARPLRDVFNDLVGAGVAGDADAAALLATEGHPDLTPDLVAEAVVSYADTASPEVAEHLAGFVREHGPVPPDPDDAGADAAAEGWLTLLTSAPDPAGSPDAFDVLDAPVTAGQVDPAGAVDAAGLGGGADPFDLDFGGGDPGAGGGAVAGWWSEEDPEPSEAADGAAEAGLGAAYGDGLGDSDSDSLGDGLGLDGDGLDGDGLDGGGSGAAGPGPAEG